MKLARIFFLIMFFPCSMATSPVLAQISNSVWGQGGVRVGTSTTTCNASAEGAIRYNSVDKWMEYCDATNWKLIVGALANASDQTPAAFSFTDATGQPFSTLVVSNSLTITGINGPVLVTVTGGGSPQIRINGGSWVTSGTINTGESLEVRLVSSGSASTALVAAVTVGDTTDNWSVTTRAGQLRIFRTANTYNGNMGGLTGADAICQAEAGTAGYGGTWKAILSDNNTNAKDRLTLSYPIVRASNTSTVVSVANLWNGTLSNAIATNGFDVRTGTNSGGIKDTWGTWCSDWTDSTSGSRQAYGVDNVTWYGWSAVNNNTYTCDRTLYLYCIEQ